MLIVCPSCASRYSIDDAKIGAGRTVRCASCQHAWFVTLTDPAVSETAPEPSPDAASDALDQDALDRLFNEQMASATHEAKAAGIDPKPPAEAKKGLFGFLRRKPKAARTKADKRRARPARTAAARREAGVIGQRQTFPGRIQPVARPLAIGLIGTILAAALVVWREAVVQRVPATAPAYAAIGLRVNPLGFDIVGLRSRVTQQAEGRVLTVDGQIISQVADERPVPPIEVLIRAENRQVIYRWAAEPLRPVVKPGESVPFRARLATPPEAGQTVEVRFAAPARAS